MKVGALIPCRTGSKGIPGKNFRDFCGKPLWEWSFAAARESGLFDKIILSSDGGLKDQILPVSDQVIYDDERPAKLANDAATLDSVLAYYAEKHFGEIDCWCILQPTSPLRKAEDIKSAFAMLDEKGKDGKPLYDSVVSVYNHPIIGWVANSAYYKGRKYHTALFHIENRPNRQDRKDWYLENGAIYFATIEAIMNRGARIGFTPGLYIMPKERSLEIDDDLDWSIAEMVMKGRAL